MDFSKATNTQLLTIMAEDCPLHYKNRAFAELQKRKDKEKARTISRFKKKAAYSDKTYHFHS